MLIQMQIYDYSPGCGKKISKQASFLSETDVAANIAVSSSVMCVYMSAILG